MDPITHTMTGAGLAWAGLRRTTPLATATLVLAANAPDVDLLTYAAGPYTALALRRGLTHGPLALVAFPLGVAAAVLAWDRAVRRRRRPDARPARPGALILLACLGTVTHPALDWLNDYGIRLLAPFSDAWFYGDAVFIVDPWVWLGLGGALFLVGSGSPGALAAWLTFWALATAAVLLPAQVPPASKALWSVGLGALLLARARRRSVPRPGSDEQLVRRAGAVVAVYGLLMVGAAAASQRLVRAALEREGRGVVGRVMVAPRPADPLRGFVVAEGADAYRLGTFRWLAPGAQRLRMEEGELPYRPEEPWLAPVVEAAARTPAARRYLTWSRFPFYRVDGTGEGYRVHIGDARYATTREAGALSGLTVWLDPQLRPAEPPLQARARGR